jgi:hypothetical protein
MPPQAAGMSCYSVAEEITSICADYLVELRGFEPMAIAGAVRSRASPVNAGSLLAARAFSIAIDVLVSVAC